MATRVVVDEMITMRDAKDLNSAVLSARGLHKAFGGQVVLRDVSLDLRRGEVVLLQGENGSGKTTLLNILTGNLEPDAGELHLSVNSAREVFRWPRRWWQNLNPFDHFTPERIAWEGVGRVWQDIRLFPTMTVCDNVVLSSPKQAGENPIMALLRLGRINKEELYNQEQASKWLNGVGLGDRLHSSCDKISLGQMKRVAIARAVQAGAKILFLDEPLSGLDGKGVAEVMRYLDSLVHTDGLTVVIVEHVFNIPRVLNLATTVWTLADGHLTVEAKDKVKNNPRATVILNLQDWLKEVAGPEGRVETHDLKEGARLTTAIPKDTENAPIILEVKDMVVDRGYRTVLDGLSLKLCKGQLALLEAPNGWGKSTLLDTITGVLRQQSGEIIFDGESINALSTDKRILKGIGYLRSRESVFDSLSIAEHQKLSKGLNLGFGENSHNGHIKANLLSGGQRQKLLIEMLPNTSVYLLDEPFIGLDVLTVPVLSKKLSKEIEQGKTILVVVPYLS
jgi:ABC-type branched-subunit amino acid transport system ATPase component